MAIFDRLKQWWSGKATDPRAFKPPMWLQATGVDEQWSLPTREDYESQLDLYTKLTWVQIAVSSVAKTGAGATLEVFELSGEKRIAVRNHPLEILLASPNPLQSRFELFQATLSYLCLTGNAYWWLNRASPTAPVDEIWMLPGSRVSPIPDENLYLRGYAYDTGNKPILLETSEIVHFRQFNPLSSFVGLSPIQALSVVAQGDLAMTRYNTNYFDKGNAKVAGALAFADPIDDDTWQAMKAETAAEYGGMRRRLMMLRDVGSGGVSWIPMALSQSDMQFLEGRTANKEEIFALFSPGLSSMLAVNATEANAMAGRATFIELAVWPMLILLAEKISNDLLAFSDGKEIASFEDIRITDRRLELEEIREFSAVHTVDEVRERWYNADPLGDDRGRLLVPELTKGFTVLPPDLQGAEDARLAAELEAQKELLELQKTLGAPNPIGGAPAAPPGGSEKPTEPNTEQAPAQEMQAEAKALRRWLKNRGPTADVARFELHHLTAEQAAKVQEEAGRGEVVTRATFQDYP